jgi:alginate O-acetyltransferase complex protein AlgI
MPFAAASTGYFTELAAWLPLPFFHTFPFLVFLALVLAVYWLTPRRFGTVRNLWLVVASFHFYAAWSAELAFLVTGTATVDYLLARAMMGANARWLRRTLLIAGIGMNLGILAYFKYANFFLDSLNAALTAAGWGSSFTLLQVVVPFGISFYTFEAISYGIDVYRRRIKAESNLVNFLLFILFFPHLVSGPIVRAGDFLPQARRPKRWNWQRVEVGLQLFLIGYFKKVALADRLAAFCDPVWADPAKFSTTATWLGVIAFAFRIYFDFSGYTDMALGSAHLLGFTLKPNFHMPYLAANVSEFWRRWHISLSTWLRDYVFIPLGGSRGGEWATCQNLMITMLLGGLWHGATWSFVIWGALHGWALIAHRQFRSWANSQPRIDAWLQSLAGTAFRIATTFSFVAFAWIFFRKDLAGAMTVLHHMIVPVRGDVAIYPNNALVTLLSFAALGHFVMATGLWGRVWHRLPAEVHGTAYAVVLLLAMLLAPDASPTFVYFDF